MGFGFAVTAGSKKKHLKGILFLQRIFHKHPMVSYGQFPLTDGVLGFKNGVFAGQLNKELGIRNGFVRKIAVVGNTLWMATEDNLIGYDVVTKAIKRYNRFDGLPSNEITDIEFLNNKILLGTPKGIVEIPENFNSINPVPPSIFISAFAIHEHDTTLALAYQLPFYNNNIRISFKGIAFRSQGEFTYKYRMLGLDTTWIVTNSKSNYARYPSLPAGRYVFQVKALNEDGIESIKAAQLNITIAPPFGSGGGFLHCAHWLQQVQFRLCLPGAFVHYGAKVNQKKE